ncbi:MAG: 50S ribosomal protein L11 methyltransferase [Actinomycetota bacterium]|nr:50S ribosomal protein L11 methyltransferase [Actinomycetota bacterium]
MIRLALRVRREDAEVALAELLALVPAGVEEVDLGDRVEYAVYGAPGELPDLPDLRAAAGDALVEVTTTEVGDDWAERWRAFHRPVEVGPLRVRPPWAEARDERDVVIDPGQAFGTGGHETTRLCLELLLEVPAEGSLVDLGCGSGVLAIAAARLGWSPVLALDFDPLAVEATAENARVNGVEVEARRFDLREGRVPAGRVVVANLLRPLLLDVARRGVEARTLIASGLLRHEADEVAAAFAAHDLVERRRAAQGDWAALLLS